ncbi:MAG: hypothetical protein IIW56_06660 [Oscillospiraceae bacterium]|nr:hypothetical protein [Oscillospiraceae bacterium]
MAYEQRQYTESDAVKKFRENMEKQAAYQSQWQPQIKDTMDSILNRKDFQYDVNEDALYQQYKDRYVNLGQQAMMDTMGQAAKLTGGYGNSNAQMVGQQAYQGYLQGLTDKIPELAQLAYQRHAQQGQDLYQKYGLLNTQEQADYNRWLAERDFLANQYNTERGFDYGQYRDTVGDDQWKAQFDEDLRRFNFQNKLGEFAPVASAGGGGGGGGGGSSGGSSNNNYQGSGYRSAEVLVKNAASVEDQQKVIDNAVSKGYVTSKGASDLKKLVGNTTYTKK